MTVNCKVQMQGFSVESSFKRLNKAIQKSTSPEKLSKYQSILEPKLYNYLKAGADKGEVPINVEDVFSLDIVNNSLTITNSDPLITELYEYGYDDEELDEIIPPRYYIRPAIKKLSNDLMKLIGQEIKDEYKTYSATYVNDFLKY